MSGDCPLTYRGLSPDIPYAGITDESELKDVDFSKAFSNYLLSHGMTPQQLQALIQSLT